MDDAKADPTPPDGTTRRFFLGAAAGLTGVALAATAAHAEAGDEAVPLAAREFTAGLLNLIIDGQQAGLLRSASGGAVSGEVVLEKTGTDGIIKKHLADVAYGEFDFQLNIPVSKPLAAQIDSMMQMTFDRFDGSVQTADFNKKVVSERRFTNALVTEVGFPALDGASKDTGALTVKISPETIRRVAKSGSTVPGVNTKVKSFLVSNFNLLIDGLDCKRVSRIEAFAIKLAVQKVIIAEPKGPLEPLFLEIPDLKITLAESGAQTWFNWFEDFVVKGNNADDREKDGTLTLLTPDLKKAFATISFSHLGIFELEPTDDAASKDTIRKVTAQLYCEQMKFKLATG